MGKRNADNENIDEPHYNNQHQPPFKKHKIENEINVTLESEFVLTEEIIDGAILTDLTLGQWRVGKPIGKGSFGEIFLASDDISRPVIHSNAKYVVKIEPHSNGPLFVEIHCLMNAGKNTEENSLPPGMPEYIASGSHYFYNRRYRFLILHRLECDLHSIIKSYKLAPKNILIIAGQIIDVLKHLHDKGYAHSDIKAENLMIGNISNCKLPLKASESVNKSEKWDRKLKPSTISASSSNIEYSGSNPLRSCRLGRKNQFSLYEGMVKSHYLRPTKNIKYCYDDDEDEDAAKEPEVISSNDNSADEEDEEEDDFDDDGEDAISEYTKNSVSSRSSSTVPEKTDEQIYLIDFGLASKFVDSTGLHHQFCQDQRRAHDGTLEFTSRDAHMGAHSRRSDLECLGYNLIYWTHGFLPWKDNNNETKYLSQPEQVHRMKEYFMIDCKKMLKLIYGTNCPKYLGEFLSYVDKLAYDESPDYDHCKEIFNRELNRLGFKKPAYLKLSLTELKMNKIPRNNVKNNPTDISMKLNKFKSIYKLDLLMPFQETGTVPTPASLISTPNQVSPKNLRSKVKLNTRSTNKKKQLRTKLVKKSICTSQSCCSSGSGSSHKSEDTLEQYIDIYNRDPDQIARKRAEKEYERGEQNVLLYETPVRYSGRPTYAILAIENKLKLQKEKEELDNSALDNTMNNGSMFDESVRKYGKPILENLSKKNISFNESYNINNHKQKHSISDDNYNNKLQRGVNRHVATAETTPIASLSKNGLAQRRRKSNLRPIQIKKSSIKKNHHEIIEINDETSCSSNATATSNSSFDSNHNNSYHKKKNLASSASARVGGMRRKKNIIKKNQKRSSSLSSNKTTSSSSEESSAASTMYSNEINTGDDDSRDTIDFSPIKTRRARNNKLKKSRNLNFLMKKKKDYIIRNVRTISRG